MARASTRAARLSGWSECMLPRLWCQRLAAKACEHTRVARKVHFRNCRFEVFEPSASITRKWGKCASSDSSIGGRRTNGLKIPYHSGYLCHCRGGGNHRADHRRQTPQACIGGGWTQPGIPTDIRRQCSEDCACSDSGAQIPHLGPGPAGKLGEL